MYFKWDLFHIHITQWVNMDGFKWLFFVMEKTSIQMLGHPSVHPSIFKNRFYSNFAYAFVPTMSRLELLMGQISILHH